MNPVMKAIAQRRSYYALSNQSPISDEALISLVKTAVKHVPSPNNLQNSVAVLLLGEEHKALWAIVENVIRQRVSPEQFLKTEKKIKTSFASGYGTILFYHDTQVTKEYTEKVPRYAENFHLWSHHASAMLQFALWTALEDVGFGASLQHYNPIIDELVAKQWNFPSQWELIAQMPFGIPIEEPKEKVFRDLDQRFFLFE